MSEAASDGMQDRITVLFMQTQTFFGADSQIHASIAEHLDRNRFRVIVACNDDAGRGSQALEQFRRIPDTDIVPMDFGPSRGDGGMIRFALTAIRGLPFVWRLVRLMRYARAQGVDVVHGTEKPRDVLYGFLVGRACGARTLTQLHVKVEDWIRPLTRRLMRHDDALVGVSRFVSRSAVDMGYRPERIHTVLNALEVERWQPGTVDGTTVRSDLDIADDVALIAIVARVFPWKGHERLIRALAAVRQRGHKFHLLIVGDDDPRATPDGGVYSSQLRGVVAELDMTDVVTFTGFRSDVPALMSAIDVFAMPSYEEPFGMVYLEAMALEKPVVGLRSGGVVEFVHEGVTGLLSDPDDELGLADNLAALIADPELRCRMGTAGRETVLARFSSPRMAQDMAAVYENVVNRVTPALTPER
jgi:glycosyltransferase involved in cell wall biosynthesis